MAAALIKASTALRRQHLELGKGASSIHRPKSLYVKGSAGNEEGIPIDAMMLRTNECMVLVNMFEVCGSLFGSS